MSRAADVGRQMSSASDASKVLPELGSTPLMLAAASGDAALLSQLLARGAELEARDAGGGTALHLACVHGHLECAEVLLDAGCGNGPLMGVQMLRCAPVPNP